MARNNHVKTMKKYIEQHMNFGECIITHKDILREQIDTINPNIIVCGNVGEMYFEIYDQQISKIQKRKVCEKNPPLTMYLHNDRVVFNAYHPSAWKLKTTQDDFIELLDKESNVLRNLLQEKR